MEFFLPPGLEKALPAFTPAQQALLKQLVTPDCGQQHLFASWPSTKETSPAILRQLVEQLESLDQSYPDGGLAGYIRNAKRLLEASQKGVNPLEGWTPSVPTAGQTFTVGTKEYNETEAQGMEDIGRVGFVLVAGGLGERLGYNGIKVRRKYDSNQLFFLSFVPYFPQYLKRFYVFLIIHAGGTSNRVDDGQVLFTILH